MSETVLNIGKLILVELADGESIEQYAEKISEGEKEKYHETFLEQLLSDHYDEYVLSNRILYHNECEIDENGGDIFEATKNEDGTINYIVQYYNGGCCFSEAIGYALKKLNS